MVYINCRYRGGSVETVDEFETRKEARATLAEYRLSFGADFLVYISTRATKLWGEK